jgi:uncharacterized RDD family membrane protein YckC
VPPPPPGWQVPPPPPGWQVPPPPPGWQSPYAVAGAWQSPYAAAGAWRSPYAVAGWPAPSYWRYAPALAPGTYVPTGGLIARFAALVIDAVLIVGVLLVLGFVMAALEGGGSSDASSGSQAGTAIGLIWWVFALMYHPACWYALGGSLGQKALGLRVARASDGQPLSLGAVLVRFTIFATVTVVIPLGLISAVMTARDPFKRAWHDKVARSIVVKRA